MTRHPRRGSSLAVGLLLHLLGLQRQAAGSPSSTPAADPPTHDWGLSLSAGLSLLHGDALHTEPERTPATVSGVPSLAINGNVGHLALGTAIEGFPSILQNGHLAIGVQAGWQQSLSRARLQLLAEIGEDAYWDIGSFLATTTPDSFNTPYVGARIGLAMSFPPDGIFEGTVSMFVRHDLDRATVMSVSSNFLGGPPAYRTYEVGGDVVGVTLRLGLRFEGRISPGAAP